MIEDTIEELAGEPHEEGLSRISFGEALTLPWVADVINASISDIELGPDHDEVEVRASFARLYVGRISKQLCLINTLRAADPSSSFLTPARAELDRLTRLLIHDLAALGAVALINSREQT